MKLNSFLFSVFLPFNSAFSISLRDFSSSPVSRQFSRFFAVVDCIQVHLFFVFLWVIYVVRIRHCVVSSKCATTIFFFSLCAFRFRVLIILFLFFFICKIGVRPAIPSRRSDRRSQSRVEPWVFPLVPLDQNSRARVTSSFLAN